MNKTNVGVLSISADASSFNGNWIVADGILRVSSANAHGTAGVEVSDTAVLDIDAANTTGSLLVKKGGKLIWMPTSRCKRPCSTG